MHDGDYKPARWVLEVMVVPLAPASLQSNSSASLISSRLVYRLGMNRAEAPLSHAAERRAEIQSQVNRPAVILLSFQIKIGTGKGRFQQKLSEIFARTGRGRRRRLFLTQGPKGLGKKLVNTPEMDFLLYQPLQFGLSDLDRHGRSLRRSSLLGYLVVVVYAPGAL